MLAKSRARRKAARAVTARNDFIRANGGCCWCRTSVDWADFYSRGIQAQSADMLVEQFREVMPKVYFETPRYQSSMDLAEQSVSAMLARVRA